MYFGLDTDIGSRPLFAGELLYTHSGDPVNITLPKLQRETDSASTLASKLLSDYSIAAVENNSNRIDESVLKADFHNTLDKICQEVHHQNCEELSKQSLENALEFQGRVDEDFIKEKVSDINIGSLLFAGELLDTNSGDPVNIALPKLQRETDSASTLASKLLSDYSIAEVENNSNRIDESVLKADFCNTFDKICQEVHHQNCEELSKQSLENALEFQGGVDEDFIKEKVSDIDIGSLLFAGELLDTNSGDPVNIVLPKLQRETDSAGIPASKLLSDCIITEVKNNSNRIDESVLEADFFNTLDKICQEVHHQYFEDLENAIEFQGRVDEDFIKEKVSDIDIGSLSLLFEGELLDTNSGDPVNIALPKLQRETDSASAPASNLLSDYTIAEVENNSNRIDESTLREDFYNTLDKTCQKEHHQNFEELSKQSLKNALEFQGRVYQNFTKEKAKLSEKQSVPPDKYKYSCIVTDCPFIHRYRRDVKLHLFKHIKVSQHYCEQCLPDTFFVRDKPNLNRHIKHIHSTDSTISKYGAKRICPPVQNTMDPFRECNVSQVSDQQQTDSASTPASNLLSDYTIAQVENNSKHQDHCNRTFSSSNTSNSKDSRKKANSQILRRIDENALKTDFYNTLDKKCQEVYHQNFEELSKQSLKNALEFQGRVYQDFIKEKAELFKKQLVSTDKYGYPCIVTNCVFTHISKAHVKTHLFKHIKVSQYYCEQCLPHTFFVRNTPDLNRHIRRIHSTDSTISKYGAKHICPPDQNTMNSFRECNVSQVSDQQQTDSASTPASNLLSDYTIAQVENNSKYQAHCNRTFSSSNTSNSKDSRKKANSQILSKGSRKKANSQILSKGSRKKANSQILSKDSRKKANSQILSKGSRKKANSQILSKDSRKKANSQILRRIDENALKTDFYNTLDKKCQEEHHQNFEELSKQSLKNALEFQGRVYQDFTKEKAKLSEKQLVPSDKYKYSCIVTDCPFTHMYRRDVKLHLFKHIKVSQHYCEQCLPDTFFVRDKPNLNRHIKNVHSTNRILFKYGAKRICPPDQNTMNGSSGFTVSQVSDPCSVLNSAKRAKTDP